MQSRPERSIVVVLHGPLTPADVPALCELVRDLIVKSHDNARVTCDVGALGTPDEVALDALARLQITARRLGTSVQLRHARGDLIDLLAATGLANALSGQPELAVELDRQTEQREETLVDEEVDGGDATA